MGHPGVPIVASPTTSFAVSLVSLESGVVVVLVGELDLDSAPQLSGVLDPLIEEGPAEIVLDLSELTFIDSSGIAALVAAQQNLNEQDRRLALVSPKPFTRKLLETVGLIEFLGVRDCDT
jgi:anti-sigma B factor antagonist